MDVLSCPSCSRRYAVHRAGDGWRCTNCSAELRLAERDAPGLDVAGRDLYPSLRHQLHPLTRPDSEGYSE